MPAISKSRLVALAGSLTIALAAVSAQAAPVYTSVGKDLSTGPFDISYMGGTITFSNGDGFPNYYNVSTNDTGAVRTVFGNPSVDFTDRGYPFYDASTLGGYAPFATPTIVGASNGNSFLGLRVESGGDFYYGFAFTTNNVLNSYGFETTANTGILGTTAIPVAVPEPATWALMIVGFGLVGGAMRRRQSATTTVRFA